MMNQVIMSPLDRKNAFHSTPNASEVRSLLSEVVLSVHWV